MSILIKGMKMPTMPETIKQGDVVPYIDVRIFADGNAIVSSGERPYYTEYAAAPVQPHGALIDRDDFFATCPELVDGYKRITDDLVVIPAEEGE